MWPFRRRPKKQKLGAPQGILERTQHLLRANIHSALDAAEDPIATIDLFIRDYTENITLAEKATAEVIGQLRLLEADSAEAAKEATDFGAKAELATARANERRAAGDLASASRLDSLAEKAVRRQVRAERRVAELAPTLTQQQSVVDQLTTGMTTMRERLEDLGHRRSDVVSRIRATEAKERVVSAITSLNTGDPTSDISRIESTVKRREALTQGKVEVATLSFQSRLDELDEFSDDALVQQRLGAIRSGSAPAELTEGGARD